MATVFKARQDRLDRFVVFKKVREELRSHPGVLKRFEREARASARFVHQNLCHVYDYLEPENESPVIVMEYVDGVDVADILARRATIPVPVALAIMLGVTRALEFIHSHKLIHRDIKPENIRISTRGDVKLMDFGIVLAADDAHLTLPGIIIGSPHYLSPEQILGEAIGPASDLFSLGITLYELVTGVRPFDSATQEEVFRNIRLGEFKPARKLNKKIPRRVDRLISKLLEVKPHQRYRSAWQLHQELREILGLEIERGFLRQYLIFQAFTEPGPGELVEPPSVPHTAGFKKALPFAGMLLGLAMTGGLGYWVGTGVNPETVAPEFCLAPPELVRNISTQERNRITGLIHHAGYPIVGYPLLESVAVSPQNHAWLLRGFEHLSDREQQIILQINNVASREVLFTRKNVLWPRQPPCQ